jgi:hypothetical protein
MGTEKKSGGGASLRSGDRIAASEAGRALGSISTPEKAAAAKRNQALRKTYGGPPKKDPLELPCTCGAGTETEVGDNHKTTCPRGRLLYQRAKLAQKEAK